MESLAPKCYLCFWHREKREKARGKKATEEDQIFRAEEANPVPSEGSVKHPNGCSPCFWFWKPQGCRNGSDCRLCHLCPEGEVKARKKAAIAKRKMDVLPPLQRKRTRLGERHMEERGSEIEFSA